MKNLTPVDLAEWLVGKVHLRPVLLDVREAWEFQTGHIGGSLTMPMQSIPDRLSELDMQQPIVCICHHGTRSMQVALFLEQQGFTDVRNLTGGVHAWSQHVDSALPMY